MHFTAFYTRAATTVADPRQTRLVRSPLEAAALPAGAVTAFRTPSSAVISGFSKVMNSYSENF